MKGAVFHLKKEVDSWYTRGFADLPSLEAKRDVKLNIKEQCLGHSAFTAVGSFAKFCHQQVPSYGPLAHSYMPSKCQRIPVFTKKLAFSSHMFVWRATCNKKQINLPLHHNFTCIYNLYKLKTQNAVLLKIVHAKFI